MMGGHGLINWAGDDKTCYELSLDIIEKAARYIESRDKGAGHFWRPEICGAWRG